MSNTFNSLPSDEPPLELVPNDDSHAAETRRLALSEPHRREPPGDSSNLYQSMFGGRIGQGLLIVLMSACAYWIIHTFLFQTVKVQGRSMSPTFVDGDFRLLNRLAYHYREPHHGEIVVLRDPTDEGLAVKRVIARPGDSLLLKDGEVYLNAVKLDEPYLPDGLMTLTYARHQEQLLIFGPDRYFVLGDNRANSLDSRFYGSLPRENILGVVDE